MNKMVKLLDTDNDGKISRDDLDFSLELELREEKADAHRKMAWAAIISMIAFTLLLFSPFMSVEKVSALGELLGLFYIAQAGIVGAYMGVTAWMSKPATPSVSRFSVAPTPKAVPATKEPEL